MLPIDYAATNRCAVRVDIKDRQENSHALRLCFQNLVFVDVDDVRNFSIGCGHNEILIGWHIAIGIAEKRESENNQ